ncbi:sulfur globule family protein, partial [Thiolapillus sp.]
MSKFTKLLGATAIAGFAALSMSSASAWWGPWGDRGYNNNSWDNMGDWLGDGSGDANFNMGFSGRGSG